MRSKEHGVSSGLRSYRKRISSLKYVKTLLLVIIFSSMPNLGCSGELYTEQELTKLGDLWLESKMIFDVEMSQHLNRVKEIQSLELSDPQKAVLLKKEYSRHDTMSEAFAETRSMVQSALIDESNARLPQNSDSGRIKATAGKQAGDAGFRRGESDLDAGASELAVKHLKEVAGEMGLDALVGGKPVVDMNKYDSAGVLELRDGFELTINKTGLAPKPGSEFHHMVTAVDARHPETFLSQKLLSKNQAGAAYIEVQDHLKKAGKGHVLTGADMLKTPENLEKARIMCKSTRKVLDLNLVDDVSLSRILQQNDLDLTPSEFRDRMFKVEGSTKGRLNAELNDPVFLEKTKNVSRDIFSASETNSFKTAKQELADLRSKAAKQPNGSGLKQVIEDEILDSVTKIQEGQAANREFRKNTTKGKANDLDQMADPRKRPAIAKKKLDSAFETAQKRTHQPEPLETKAKIFKTYNDLNDAAQLAKIVEDYMEGRASLSKTLVYATASVADMTFTQGAAGAIVQTGEKIDDLKDAKAKKSYAEQRNMEAYLNAFAMQFRKGGMSKKDAVALVEEAAGKNDLSILKLKIRQLKEEGHSVREPYLERESGVKADDTALERADMVLAGGGGQKIVDAWTAYDNIDNANRQNLELYLSQWELQLRKAGVEPNAAREMIGKAILLDDFSYLQQRALELKAQGKDISLPVLRHDTIEQDDTVWERIQNYELTKHTILAPSRTVDAWAQGELAEAELEMRSISQKAETKTALYQKLLVAGIDSKRALTALNNWDDGESGLLEMVLGEAKANIKDKRLAEKSLLEAQEADAQALEKLQESRLQIQKVISLLHELKAIAYQVECDPYPLYFKEGQEKVGASVVVTSKQNPEMYFSSLKASLQSVFGKSPNTHQEYLFSLPGTMGPDNGIWQIELPAKEAVYPLDVQVTTVIESNDPALQMLNRTLSTMLSVDIQVTEEILEQSEESLPSEESAQAVEDVSEESSDEQYAWIMVEIVDYDPAEAREKNNSNLKIPYRRDSSYGRGSFYKKDTYRGKTDTWHDPDMINGEYCAIQATWSKPPTIIHADEKVTLNVSIAAVGRDLSYFSFGGSTFGSFDHAAIRPGYARNSIPFKDKAGINNFTVDSKNDYAAISREVSATAPSAGAVENRMALVLTFPTQVGSLGTKYVYEWQKIGSGAPKFSDKDLTYPHPILEEPAPKEEKASKALKVSESNDGKSTEATVEKSVAKIVPPTQPGLPHPPGKTDAKVRSESTGTGSSLTLDKQAFLPGEQVSVHFTASKDFPSKAWVGLYPSEVPHIYEKVTTKKYLAYHYLEKKTEGTLTFTAPVKTGNYDFRMHDRDSGAADVEVATVSFVVHNPSYLSVEKNTYAEGEDISVSFGVEKAHAKDWIAICAKDSELKKYISYQYTRGQTKGELKFKAEAPGEYQFRFFGKDKWERLAPDVSITVIEGERSLKVNGSSFNVRDTISVSFAIPLPHAKDWVGLYRKQDPDKKYIKYVYTTGKANGALVFEAPKEAGVYEFRFFEKDGWKRIAVSSSFNVSD